MSYTLSIYHKSRNTKTKEELNQKCFIFLQKKDAKVSFQGANSFPLLTVNLVIFGYASFYKDDKPFCTRFQPILPRKRDVLVYHGYGAGYGTLLGIEWCHFA